MVSEGGGAVTVPHINRFDSNIITPGTEFMVKIRWLDVSGSFILFP